MNYNPKTSDDAHGNVSLVALYASAHVKVCDKPSFQGLPSN